MIEITAVGDQTEMGRTARAAAEANPEPTPLTRQLLRLSKLIGVFGLGFAVVINPAAGKVVCSEGEFNWGGLASTTFWIDPAEDLSVVFMTQLLPSSTYNIRPQLRQLVYQSIVD